MNKTKFTAVVFYEDETTVHKYDLLTELIQDIFIAGWDNPNDTWIRNPSKYREQILEEINYYIDEFMRDSRLNIFYIENNEIQELSLDQIDDDEYITAYLTYYEN